MPARISDETRQAIAADIRAELPRNQIARKYDVSSSTVTLIARENGLTFDRSMTKRATEARITDAAALRAETSMRFLHKAGELISMMDGEYLAYSFGGRDNTYNEHRLDRPPDSALRNLMVTAATAFDKHLAADRHDSDEHGLAAVDTWLRDMLGSD